jgi:putative glycerol-1-phosphate prenyltransferase
MTVWQRLLQIRETKGADYLVLLDPDRKKGEDLAQMARTCESAGADGILVGGSLLFSAEFDRAVQTIHAAVSIPVILFPGAGSQLSAHADALLFISIISGRNAHYLIGEQALSAPVVKALGLEAIGTGYMLVDSGGTTSVEFMSGTRPIPREKPDIAVAHALAAQYLGMPLVYLEAGSGASEPVPDRMVRAVAQTVSIPVMVGGGIQTPEQAAIQVNAGAAFVITGNVLEDRFDPGLIEAFARAVHFRDSPGTDRV